MIKEKDCFVSVIIPIYNAERYLKECLESVVNQTYRNLDIVLIDDGSKDQSLKICREYQEKDSRVRVISKNNEGVSATRNRGIEEARGQWISFVDSDDIIAEDYVKDLVRGLSEDVDICFVNSTKDLSELNKHDSGESVIIEICKDTLQLFERGLLNKYAIKTPIHLTSTCAKLYNKDFLSENSIFFPKGLVKSEDAIFNMYVYHYATKGKWCNKPLYYYRMNAESATHRYDVDVVETYEKHLELIYEFYAEKSYPDFENDYNVRVFFDMIYCIVNKFCHINNPEHYRDRNKEFLRMVKRDPFQHSLESIKTDGFSIPEKILAFCMKKKFFLCMNLLIHIAQSV